MTAPFRSITLSIACLAALVGCGSTDKSSAPAAPVPTVLHLSTITFGDGPAAPFTDEVKRLSGGALTIQIDTAQHRDSGRAGDPAILADVLSGKVPLGVVTIESLQAKGVRSLDPLAAPGLITSVAAAGVVDGGPIAKKMLDEVTAKAGVVGLAVVPGRLRYLVGVPSPVKAVADLSNQTVKLFEASTVAADAFKAAGANVVLDNRTDTVKSGERALDSAASDISNREMTSVAHYLMGNVPLWTEHFVVVANKKAFDGLSSSFRSVLAKAGSSSAAISATAVQQEEDGALLSMCNAKLVEVDRLAPAEVTALSTAMKPVTDAMRADPDLGPIVKDIDRSVAGIATPAALECVAGAAPDSDPVALTGAAAALVGVWKLDVTQELFDKAHPLGNEVGGVGLSELTFTPDGHFDYSVGGGHLPSTGVWVDGDLVIIKILGTCTQCGAGETWRYHWSVFGDKLTLTRAPGAGVTLGDGPTGIVAGPYTRSN